MQNSGTLFEACDASAAERIDALVSAPDCRIERIVSEGQASPEAFWYDQPEEEWVVLLQGRAALRFADEAQARILNPGDWLRIPAHCRHRVEWTEQTGQTIWLAVHYANEPGGRQ